jgi:hypothetical protein
MPTLRRPGSTIAGRVGRRRVRRLRLSIKGLKRKYEAKVGVLKGLECVKTPQM